MSTSPEPNQINYQGNEGGAWDRRTHEVLYGANLNTGLGDFVLQEIAPENFLEFGSGLGGLANYIATRTKLEASYCLEPEVEADGNLANAVSLLNVNVLSEPAPSVLDKLFDMVFSIEVAEHVPQDKHEELFDFLVSRAGRIIVFSGARPGQGGHGHVAERPELEWREEFTKRGCRFDPALTLRARNMCNTRNINHRQNVQVFHAPDRSTEILNLEARAKPYLADLLSIVLRHGQRFTGNLFYVDLKGALGGRPDHSLHWKRENLLKVGATATNILEVGFAAGHSALLLLLANPHSHITIVDPEEFPHVKGCVAYLKSVFPGRVTFVSGYSTDVLANLEHGKFDLVHLDGGKDMTIVEDLDLLKPLVSRSHVLCIDDTQNAGIQEEVQRRTDAGELVTAPFAEMTATSHNSPWTHCIARFSAETSDLRKMVWQDLQHIFHGVTHQSIYTSEDASGHPRSDYLIKAIQDVEANGLTGAFVEVGIAAGHSSVVAALASSPQKRRDFYLYDTFVGFGEHLPDEKDLNGTSIRDYDLSKYMHEECSAPSVRSRVVRAGQPERRIFTIEGYAQNTIPRISPPRIAILRLDADLFDPTIVALRELYDLVEDGGYIIVDDYGHWPSCASAVNLFFDEKNSVFPGEKIDETCYGWQK